MNCYNRAHEIDTKRKDGKADNLPETQSYGIDFFIGISMLAYVSHLQEPLSPPLFVLRHFPANESDDPSMVHPLNNTTINCIYLMTGCVCAGENSGWVNEL